MCGIVAVLRRRADEAVPALAGAELIEQLEQAGAGVSEFLAGDLGNPVWVERAQHASLILDRVDRELRRSASVRQLVNDEQLALSCQRSVEQLAARLGELEGRLDEGLLGGQDLEAANVAVLRLKDSLWAVQRDRLASAAEIRSLARLPISEDGAVAWMSIQAALSALDRLEVRGRDSAGLHLWVSGHGVDVEAPSLRTELDRRCGDPRFAGGAMQVSGSNLGFVYKTAAEIGELGDNGRELRRALHEDQLLQTLLQRPGVEVAVLGHTRWASVGLISEPNAHPLNEQEVPALAGGCPVVAALNGDVDNYADLKAEGELQILGEITTDAKVIPVLMGRRIASGSPAERAFLETVSAFVGSVAVAASTGADPETLYLALRGSGQALYVGLLDDGFMVASEPYGLVAQTSTYLRLDGETPGNPDNPSASRGQVVILDRKRAGELDGIERFAYDGTSLPVSSGELQKADITTRDIDRGHYSHYLVKEISESPNSFRKTLRGKFGADGRVELGYRALPEQVRQRWRSGELQRVLVIGQGTAAIAGQGVARALQEVLASAGQPRSREIRALPATELSGFELREDMSSTLVVAISQSGTTTDTNRTVDLVRARGAAVLSIVNRRHSDLTDKSDGVLYTSDGRDVEMSVASTKAFYSQIAAGFLLAFALLELDLDLDDAHGLPQEQRSLREELQRMPEAMEGALEQSERIAAIADRHAPRHRYWAVVGNGPNRTAAEEVRIKLSELCYKSIACDVTEDKKHIDLSSEPLILVCASGLTGSTADDVAKEVAIYRAHKAVPIVIATEGEWRFQTAVELITVPRTHSALSFVLSALAGHLFGYHAALAIDRQALPLREMRAQIERQVAEVLGQQDALALDPLDGLRQSVREINERFFAGMEEGRYDGHLEASTAVELASLLRIVDGSVPLESYRLQRKRPATPGVVLEELGEILTRAIDELTRPVDAIKHQAKTVTVGISRSDEALLMVPLVHAFLETGADRDRVSYDDLKTLAALDPAVEKVLGFTRYRLDGDPDGEDCRIHVIDTGGISRDLRSRTSASPGLKGTKRSVAVERRLLVARGLSDGRTFVLVPEVDGDRAIGVTLLHARFRQNAPASVLRGVLGQYRGRYSAMRDAVMETEPSFREDLFEYLPVEDLLVKPIHVLAEQWRDRQQQLRQTGGRS